MALLLHGDPKTTRYQPCPSIYQSINQSIRPTVYPPSRCPRLSYGLIQIIINANYPPAAAPLALINSSPDPTVMGGPQSSSTQGILGGQGGSPSSDSL